MAQPSVACFFNNRKRPALDDQKITRSSKILKQQTVTDTSNLDENPPLKSQEIITKSSDVKKIVYESSQNITLSPRSHQRRIVKVKRTKNEGGSRNIQEMLGGLGKSARETTPPPSEKSPTNSLELIKQRISKSSRLRDLKASLSRFNEAASKLKEAEQRTAEISGSPKLKNFKTIEIEVPISPQKVASPEKAYLSPKKDAASVRRNLLGVLSPTKNAVALPESPSKQILETTSKPALKLPFKYRYLEEMFYAVEVIAQIMFNRKETITFKRLKPGVEKMIKRTLTEKHLAQIKQIFPNAYSYTREKLRVFGAGAKLYEWQLVLIPQLDDAETKKITEQILLERRRNLANALLDRVKDYHDEFLKSLVPPLLIEKTKITRWHPEFDLEKVPDIEDAHLPPPPVEENLTGQQILEKARVMFNCNTRMEQAMARLQAAREAKQVDEPPPSQTPESLLKGIPKALLEKVRQRQAAKNLASMTRSADKDKEVQLYSRLPEIARLTRNLFVAEKKGVLLLDSVLDKLGNSYRTFLNKVEMETHLRTISTEVPDWIIFHNIRNAVYIKLVKDADLSLVLSKLENTAKLKSET